MVTKHSTEFDSISVQYTANVVTVSIFDALSIGSGLMAAVVLCVKRGVFIDKC